MIRKHYQDIDYKPFLFYVIFGVSGEELQVSQSRHHVDAFPEGLELHALNRTKNGDYMAGFFQGTLGDVLKDANPVLFDKCREADDCVILKGQIRDDSTFDYMRNVIGIIQAFIDQGAVGILDFLTFSLFTPQGWTENYFEKEINAQNHVMILFSEEADGLWLHTRGMLEFGRPDLSLSGVSADLFDEYKQILDQMIFYSGHGVFFNGEYKLHTADGNTYRVRSEFVDDFDNDDFNNAYCKVEILE